MRTFHPESETFPGRAGSFLFWLWGLLCVKVHFISEKMLFCVPLFTGRTAVISIACHILLAKAFCGILGKNNGKDTLYSAWCYCELSTSLALSVVLTVRYSFSNRRSHTLCLLPGFPQSCIVPNASSIATDRSICFVAFQPVSVRYHMIDFQMLNLWPE